MYMTLCT